MLNKDFPNRLYYAKDNTYGSATSWGFENTWYIKAFPTPKERDEHVKNSVNITCRAVSSRRAYEIMHKERKECSYLLFVDGKRIWVQEYSSYGRLIERELFEDGE